MNILRMRLRSLFSRRQLEDELDEELRYHFDREMDVNLAAGLNRDEARWAALRSVGGLEQRKEECRDMRGLNLIDNLVQDTRFAIRQLRKSLGFSFTAILMLALGMGASVAIFAFVDATLIKPLPYRDPTRLVGVFETVPLFPHSNLSYADYLDWKKMNKVFQSLDAYDQRGFILTTAAGAEPVRVARVTDGFFRTLGVTPIVGRDFYSGEDLPSAHRAVLLSYGTWQKRFSGKADVVGQVLTMDGEPSTIVGVLPRDFHFAPAEPAEFWAALHPAGGCDLRRSCHSLYGVARLRDGVTVQSALADVKVIAKQLEAQYPDSNRDQGAAVASLTEVITGDIRPILLVLLGGSVLVLLIAGVNAANLLLVRSESRRREMAVRSALGASKLRLIRQFVTEGLVLVAAGSVLGLVASYWTMQLLTRLVPANLMARMPFLQDLALNPRVLAFAGEIALLALILFTVTPAFHLSFGQTRDGLAEGSRGSAGTAWRRLGSKLVVLELATAVVLLVGAGLLGKSLYSLLRVDIGFRPDHLVTLGVAAPQSGYAKDEQAGAMQRAIVDRIESLPGVTSVGLTSSLPVGGNGNTTWFRVIGRPWHGEHNEVPERDVSAGYFTTLGARLIRGRYFTEGDDASKPRVAIVNQAMARQYFPGEDPIGKHLTYLTDPPKPIEIVGIVDDIKEGPLEVATVPALYIPFKQDPSRFFNLVVRTAQSEQQLLPALTATIRGFDSGIVTAQGATMTTRINDSPSAYLHRSSAWLVGGFALLALLLGVIGLYGVVAYSVSQRTREIGLRMALGAQPGSVYQLILKEAGWLTAFGVGIGLLCAVAAATLIRRLLFGVETWDLTTLAGVSVVLAVSSMLASFLPARRAARVNPVEALRAE
ncbi:ADOP family duplicated permease [uncultured Paludibaculum sp.]|uniref:ABC transporter permease n=1 Tax=uncultured Paludibaculum sp. TaxID=1765020 RepID=UPI00374D9AF0